MDRYAPPEMVRFLRALDSELHAPVRVTIIGGAAIGLVYDPTHATTDIDLVPVGSAAFWTAVETAKGKLAHAVPVSSVAIFVAPYQYEDRLVRLDLPGLVRLIVDVPEAHDLALMKVARGESHDLAAVADIHRRHTLELDCLVERFWETLTQVTGSSEDFRLSFLTLIELLFGAATADGVEARLRGEKPPPIAT